VLVSNRTAATESCVIKLAPEFANGAAGTKRFISSDTASSKDDRQMFFTTDAPQNDVKLFPNVTQTVGSSVLDVINDTWLANTAMTLGYSVQSTGNPNVAGYFDGVTSGTDDNDDFTANDWGTNFYIGSNPAGASPLYGTIKSVVFFSDLKTAEDHENLHQYDWNNCTFK
jgi:hypothetical protein